MDIKWTAIMAIGIFGAMFLGIGISEHQKSQCRITAIQAKMPVDEIAKVCR